jgi:hypothetical protein
MVYSTQLVAYPAGTGFSCFVRRFVNFIDLAASVIGCEWYWMQAIMDYWRYYLSIGLEDLRSFTAMACLNYCWPRSLINWGIFARNHFEGKYFGLFEWIMSANGGQKWGKSRKRRLATGPNVHVVITVKICSFLSVFFYGVFIIMKRLLGRLWRRLEDNIKMKFK